MAILNFKQEISELAKRNSELKKFLADDQKAEERIRARPILAIFQSMGESIPDKTPIAGEEALMKRVKSLRQWTGISNMDHFWEEVREWFPNIESKKPPTFSARESLLMFLMALRKGFNFSQLKLLTGLSRTQTTRIFKKVLKVLLAWSVQKLTFPTLDEWRARQSDLFRRLYDQNTYMFFVDGTVLPCLKSSIPALNRAHWNFKHQFTGKNFTIVITQDGGIVCASNTTPGKTHDRVAWNESNILGKLCQVYGDVVKSIENGELSKNIRLAIGGDKGYPGIVIPRGWTLHITGKVTRVNWTDHKNAHYDPNLFYCPKEDKIVFDNRLAEFRSEVERTFGDLKQYELLVNPTFVWDHYEELDDCIQVVCALHNYNLYLPVEEA